MPCSPHPSPGPRRRDASSSIRGSRRLSWVSPWPQNCSLQSTFMDMPAQRSCPKAIENSTNAVDLRRLARDTPARSLLPQCPTWVYGALLPETNSGIRSSDQSSIQPRGLRSPSPQPPLPLSPRSPGHHPLRTQHPTHEAPEVDGVSILNVQVSLGPTKAGDDRLAAGE